MSVKEIPPVSKKPLRVLLVDRPGSVQSVIRMLMPGPAFNSPERVPFEALGTILGGSFTSRLNQNLREDKGYTYGANSRFTFLPSLGYLSAGASVRTDVTGASLKEFVFEFNKIRTEGISADEAAKASSILQTNVIESLATMEGLLQVAQRLNENGKAFGTLGEDLTAMRSLNKSVLDSLAKDAIAFDDALIVIVGDKQAILPQLAGLGLPTPLEVVAK
jgi:predicted Zn-dependent peptidase